MTKDLIFQVKKIDRKAALWLEKKYPRLKNSLTYSRFHTDSLSGSFIFCDTPQGHKFWERIAIQLPIRFK